MCKDGWHIILPPLLLLFRRRKEEATVPWCDAFCVLKGGKKNLRWRKFIYGARGWRIIIKIMLHHE